MTDFRALCAELLDELQYQTDCTTAEELQNRARAALAEPEPEAPTDEQLNILWNCSGAADEYGNHTGNIFEFARAALARWGKSTSGELQP